MFLLMDMTEIIGQDLNVVKFASNSQRGSLEGCVELAQTPSSGVEHTSLADSLEAASVARLVTHQALLKERYRPLSLRIANRQQVKWYQSLELKEG